MDKKNSDVMFTRMSYDQARVEMERMVSAALLNGVDIDDPRLEDILQRYLVSVGWVPDEYKRLVEEETRVMTSAPTKTAN